MLDNSSVTSNYLLVYDCSTVSFYSKAAVYVLRVILLLPLSTLVLYLGHQRRLQQRFFKTASHSDVFTYHVAAMELIWVLGCFLLYGGTYTNQSVILKVGSVACVIVYYGEVHFHVLTCVERYLAVVHPIIYLKLKNARGVRIRNISIGCVWLLCFGLGTVTALYALNNNSILLFCFLVFCIILISFCSLSVLCVLIRPGPGKKGGEKERVNQSKLRAFYNIIAITCAVWFWFLGLLVYSAVITSPLLSSTVKCLVQMSAIWFNLPSSLVLPLLYLYRIGKLSCCL